MNELEKRKRDAPKYERYLFNILQGFSIVDSWNMAIWDREHLKQKNERR